MENKVSKTLAKLRSSVVGRGGALSVLFFDRDFGVAVILLRLDPPTRTLLTPLHSLLILPINPLPSPTGATRSSVSLGRAERRESTWLTILF